MKLRNKKTGEIREINNIIVDGMFTVNSLAELNEDWEDMPEEYWFVAGRGVVEHALATGNENDPFDKGHRELGNYFETKEEAEKAVEKLKAWKRLKDAGFKFVGNGVGLHTLRYSYEGEWCLIVEDFNLLFGGEE